MDTILELADEYFFDGVYAKLVPKQVPLANATTNFLGEQLATTSAWERDSDLRICLSLSVFLIVGATLFYFASATFSYFVFFDKEYMKHPRFLKNQVRLEIESATKAIPGFALLTVPWFWGEIKGYSLLYEGTPATLLEWAYLALTVPLFLLFTDCGIYWVHRYLHHPLLYKHLHKPHHKWLIPTPYSAYAFHPLDGYFQSIPYHLFVYIVPMHKWLYMSMFMFVNIWTILIHDGNFISRSTIINTSAHHAVHHLYFNYNYGQYFTFWDRFGESHRAPTEEQYDAELRINKKTWAQQAKEAEEIEGKVLKTSKQKVN
ncbi:hypothetical protein BDB00DRAFT_809983 [Zychaea mexicana]|uniref:uncharacterized protein n=1 Tax=Zychaea mexicana TaxID=64656 RepID=UPI0022FF256D|nr:uncharacterized protein BDB00DRAFT_809983 [Zychaea mexicana]KAI9496331.1 hypothetical protein BDB00DRAFT_809983 [Zychaea mexicana]